MVDLDFGDLLTEIGGRVKRKPHGRPEQQALPSEQAIGDLVKGAEEAISIPANYSDGTPTPNQTQGEMFSLPDSQASATMQGIADEPANSKDVYAQRPDMGSLIPYQRDAEGYAIRPEGVDPQARMQKSDGTESAWTWAGQDEVRASSGKPAIGTQGRVADDPAAGTQKGDYLKAEPYNPYNPDGSRKRPMDEWDANNPTYGEPNLDTAIRNAEAEYQKRLNAPVEKQSFWKDFGAKLIQGADAFFNGNRAPIVGWGRLKHDQAIQNANAKLNPLIAQKKQEQEFAYNDARVGKFKADQENQVRDDNDRFVQSIRKRKYYDPAKATVAEKTRLATMNLKPEDLGSWDDRDPKTVKWGDAVWQYNADKKAWVESGIAKDPTLKPEVYEVDETDADGKVIKNADGTPRTRKFVTTSKGGAALQEYANSRKASLRLGQDRLNETVRSGKVREGLAQQQFQFAQKKWNDTMALRAEAMARRDAAQASGDIESAKKAELDAQKFQSQLDNWKVGWKTKIGTGGFTEEDYKELIGEQ